VADERALPVVVQDAVRDSDAVASVSDIKEAVVVVLIMVAIGAELNVVNPDIVSGLDTNGIASFGENIGDLHITDDDIALLVDTEADTDERRTSLAEDSFVGADPDGNVTGDCSGDVDDRSGVAGQSRGESRETGHGGDSAALSTSSSRSITSGSGISWCSPLSDLSRCSQNKRSESQSK